MQPLVQTILILIRLQITMAYRLLILMQQVQMELSLLAQALTVDLSAASGQDVTVNYTVTGTATGSGTDYTLANGTLTISAGDTSGTITIAGIVDDTLDEVDETVIVTLSSPTNATLGSDDAHTYTITDNDNAPVVDFNLTASSEPSLSHPQQ